MTEGAKPKKLVHKATKVRQGDVVRIRVRHKGHVIVKCPEGTEVAIERGGS